MHGHPSTRPERLVNGSETELDLLFGGRCQIDHWQVHLVEAALGQDVGRVRSRMQIHKKLDRMCAQELPVFKPERVPTRRKPRLDDPREPANDSRTWHAGRRLADREAWDRAPGKPKRADSQRHD